MNEAISISFADVKHIFQRQRGKLLSTALLCALTIFLLLLFRTPTYHADASFRQSSRGDEMKNLKGLFTNLQLATEDSDAISFMLSRRLLTQVCREMGLQAHIRHNGWAVQFQQNALRNLIREWGGAASPPEDFQFRDVVFSGELPEKFFIVFKENGDFELLHHTDAVLCTGKIWQKVQTPTLSFTLTHVPESITTEKKYPLKLMPIDETIQNVLRSLQIKPSKLNIRLLTLGFEHPQRQVCTEFLDRLMQAYQSHLREENDRAATEQLVFLDKRRDLLAVQLNDCLQNYADYLKKNLRENGVMGLLEHLELTVLPLETQYVDRLSQIALEKQSFQAKEKKTSHPFQLASSANPKETRTFQGVDKDAAASLYTKYNEELESTHLRINQLTHLIQRTGHDSFEISALSGFLTDAISQDLIRQASDLSLTLLDRDNRSEKEQERIRQTLNGKKRFLQEHLNERLELEKVSARVLQQKIHSLRDAALDLLHNEEQQILSQLQLFREQMSGFPDKWRLENALEFKKNMTIRVIDAMSQLSETKVVQNLLFQVESKPLDTAYSPIKTLKPALFLSTLAAFCLTLFSLLTFRLLFCKTQ